MIHACVFSVEATVRTFSYFSWFFSLATMWGLSITASLGVIWFLFLPPYMIILPSGFANPLISFAVYWGFGICECCLRRKMNGLTFRCPSPLRFWHTSFHCFLDLVGDLSELLPFFLQPSSYRSHPAGQPRASALPGLVCSGPAAAASTGRWCWSLL